MNIEESIALRNELQWKIKTINSKLTSCAKVQEGKTPIEDPYDILDELKITLDEYSNLLTEMKSLNHISIYKDKDNLNNVLAKREVISAEKEVLENFLKALKVDYSKYNTFGIKYVCTVNPNIIEKKINELNKQYNEIESKFKTTKWNVDITKMLCYLTQHFCFSHL